MVTEAVEVALLTTLDHVDILVSILLGLGGISSEKRGKI